MFDIINLSLSVVTFFLYLSILTSSGTVICILLFKLTDAKKIVILFFIYLPTDRPFINVRKIRKTPNQICLALHKVNTQGAQVFGR